MGLLLLVSQPDNGANNAHAGTLWKVNNVNGCKKFTRKKKSHTIQSLAAEALLLVSFWCSASSTSPSSRQSQ
jgi:hypothetical protein